MHVSTMIAKQMSDIRDKIDLSILSEIKNRMPARPKSETRWLPHVTVAAVVQREGRFLLVEENSVGQRVINQPAGHLEAGETMVEAVKREVLEETGWLFEPTALLGVYHFVGRNQETYIRFAYQGKVIEQIHPGPTDPQIISALWLNQQELDQRALRSVVVQQTIDDFLTGHDYPSDVVKSVLVRN